jgi:hypothetical protein
MCNSVLRIQYRYPVSCTFLNQGSGMEKNPDPGYGILVLDEKNSNTGSGIKHPGSTTLV